MTFQKNIPSMVLVKANWCGHCKHFLPTWEALQQRIPADKMNLVTLDSDVNKDFISRISTLRGYPTIYYVPEKGAAMMYGGSRDFISLVDYINNAIGYELVKV